MRVFSEKLSRLADTVALVDGRGAADLASALSAGRGRPAVAIGSGGSVVTAEYFARCRTTLGLGPTIVMTPMQFALSMDDWVGAEIWLFSAGASNPDVSAAFRCAASSMCAAIRLLTVRADGHVAVAAAEHPGAEIFVLPVADPKDGFLATHSMVAMVSALLFASDRLVERSYGRTLTEAYLARTRSALTEGGRDDSHGFRAGDTVIVLHDPQVSPVAALVETSLWETGIAPVQRADFRNFAHGRHVWAAKYPGTMFVLSMTTCESESVWRPISHALPADVRRAELGFGHGGRLANAVGVVRGLAVISQLGDVAGIDPGRPGRGPFAEVIYDNAALEDLVSGFSAAVRHKAQARQLHDPIQQSGASLGAIGRARLRELGAAEFVGVVLDYDGTIVPNEPTEARLGPPVRAIMDELARLVDCGVGVGFATGRGGSAGEKLREALPESMHRHVLMGYYNGAHLRTLDVDIRSDRPEPDPRLSRVARWIAGSGLLREGVALGTAKAQLTIGHGDVVDRETFAQELASCPEVAELAVRVLASHHSFDVVPAGTSKLRVVEAVAARARRPGGLVLGIGDSGSPLGNDHELLSNMHGVSVDSVCGSHPGTWTLFGSRLQGPEAVAKILQAARCREGGVSIDVASLAMDLSA